MKNRLEIAAALREGLDGLNDEIGKLEERRGFAILWSNAGLQAELDARLAELRAQAAQTERDLAALEPPRAPASTAEMVQKASPGGRAGGRRGGAAIPHLPAMISAGGVIWSSPLPDSREQCDFFNGAADRINASTH